MCTRPPLPPQDGFFSSRTSPLVPAATALLKVFPSLGFAVGANTTLAGLTAIQQATLVKGAYIGQKCIIKVGGG